MKVLQAVVVPLKQIIYQSKLQNIPSNTMLPVTYFSQWESKTLVKNIVTQKRSAKDDPLWKHSGAKTKKEYLHWSWNGCGMACLKMILFYKMKREFPLVTLGKMCTAYGGYSIGEKAFEIDKVESSIAGLYYKPFVSFVHDAFGIQAAVKPYLSIAEILYYLSKNMFVIASVSPNIRERTSRNYKPGGHLILLIGYNKKKNTLYFHNPSGFSKRSQEKVAITYQEFSLYFAKRGIILH